MEQFYILFTFLLIGSTIMVVISHNPIHSVFWLVSAFLNGAGFMVTLEFDFLGLIFIIIYVGAITILFLFVIMMLDVTNFNNGVNMSNITPVVFIIFVVTLPNSWLLLNYKELNLNEDMIFCLTTEFASHISNLSLNLYTEYATPFIVVSLLLLIAMIGAIVLTIEINSMTNNQSLSHQHHSNNSWT